MKCVTVRFRGVTSSSLRDMTKLCSSTPSSPIQQCAFAMKEWNHTQVVLKLFARIPAGVVMLLLGAGDVHEKFGVDVSMRIGVLELRART